MLEFMEARPAASEPIQTPLVGEIIAIVVQCTFLRCGSPSIEPSGGANAANVGARRANERGRTAS